MDPSPAPQTVLAVGAHPSDPIANIGGTAVKHVDRGDRVVLLSLTDGVEVHTEKLVGESDDEIGRINRENATNAAKILGVDDYRFLDFGDEWLVCGRLPTLCSMSGPMWSSASTTHFG